MLKPVFAEIGNAARSAALSGLGALLATVGAGFLTAALWMLLARAEGALFAASVIGALYLGLGLLILGLGSGRRRRGAPPQQGRDAPGAENGHDPIFMVAEGFAAGLQAGRRARSPGG